MKPTTDELIKEECKCDIADMRRCCRCGQLQGRLDVLEWLYNGLDIPQMIDACEEEIAKIKEELK